MKVIFRALDVFPDIFIFPPFILHFLWLNLSLTNINVSIHTFFFPVYKRFSECPVQSYNIAIITLHSHSSLYWKDSQENSYDFYLLLNFVLRNKTLNLPQIRCLIMSVLKHNYFQEFT